MQNYTIRRSTERDLPVMRQIYAGARARMRAAGNMQQWGPTDLPEEKLANDIAAGCSFVLEQDGVLAGTFAFLTGDDPTYAVIENGSWPSGGPYGTIHRIAAAPGFKGILAAAVSFCLQHTGTLRIDTHADNGAMQHACLKLGFRYCGIIYEPDGSPRLAYQLGPVPAQK